MSRSHSVSSIGPGELTVRRATTADISAIQRCLSEAFEPHRQEYTTAGFADTVPDRSGIEGRLTSMAIFVACDDGGEVVGTVSAQVLTPGEGHLRGMAVRPQWQGTAAAPALLTAAEGLLRDAGCDAVSLDTTHPLARAQRFYQRNGFAATGRVQDFFGMPLFEYRKLLARRDAANQRRVLILMFDRVEVLDFAGPHEVFSLATGKSGERLCSVETVGVRSQVTCTGGLTVSVDFGLAECPAADLLVVPGGPGARIPDPGHSELVSFLTVAPQKFPLITSVCTGSFLLARAGLLAGLSATTHPDRMDEFRAEFPRISLQSDKIVDHPALITAGGISSGIDLALHVLERWFGCDCRAEVARRLDGAWK
jgi:putative intracellular protease/amidase/ribosomal protein S18 acetylase RimI-like enzyme